MLEIGQTVMYAGSGVCTVADIEQKDMGIGLRRYYALAPLGGNRNTYYVPVDSPAAQKLSPLLTAKEAQVLLNTLSAAETPWIGNDTARQEHFRRCLGGTDRTALGMCAKSLLTHRKQLQQTGRRLRSSDERFLTESLDLLTAELTAVFGEDADACRNMLLTVIQ